METKIPIIIVIIVQGCPICFQQFKILKDLAVQ
jgi:hypothetical protein